MAELGKNENQKMMMMVMRWWMIGMMVSAAAMAMAMARAIAENSNAREGMVSEKISSTSKIPAFFLFGDSIADTGNNNRLLTVARANFSPYGENFVDSAATGRFSDGLLAMDYIAEYLGLPFVPPYLGSGGDNIWQGVCFASAGSGILEATGERLGQRISLSKQLQYFRQMVDEIAVPNLGEAAASVFIANSLHLIVTGSNDFLSQFNNAATFPPSFQSELLTLFFSRLQELYDLGARKIVVVSVPPLGCLPSIRSKRSSRGGGAAEPCDASLNAAVREYNAALREEVERSSLEGAKILYANAFDVAEGVIKNPRDFGFSDVTTACCGLSAAALALPCLPLADASSNLLCPNASDHFFWDSIHPTSAAYRLIAQRLWNGSSSDISPINIRLLSLL